MTLGLVFKCPLIGGINVAPKKMKEKSFIKRIQEELVIYLDLVYKIIILGSAIISLIALWRVHRNDANITTQRKEINALKESTSRIALTLTVTAKIQAADAYVEFGGDNNTQKALEIYDELLTHSEIRRGLDNELLNQALSDRQNGYIKNALRKYQLIFKKMLKYDN